MILDRLEHPIIQAPLAGGPSTVELAAAVSGAGGLGFLAAGYKRAEAVGEEIRAVRAATDAPFGVNLFVPSAEPADRAALDDYLRRIAPEAERQGVELGEPRFDDDDWAAKLEVVYQERPAVASFTFGCPDEVVVNRLHGVGVAVWVTVTQSSQPAARSADTADRGGAPKVNDTADTGRSTSSRTLAANPSSSWRGAPSSTPARRASGTRLAP